MRSTYLAAICCLLVIGPAQADEQPLAQTPNTWVKRSPLKGGPLSPGLGYEASFGYDPSAKAVIRWAGHNQGGGGEQNAETWIFEPATAKWTLKEPNTSPPGVCCAQQNVFDLHQNRFIRFPAFSGSHGWQWFREIYLNNSSAWSYDLATNTWRDLRTVPAPRIAPLRCASWDSAHQVIVVFGGEGSYEGTLVFDPYTNTWTRMAPAKQPEPRSAGNMAYHAGIKKHILFGSQFSNDPHTWAYDLVQNEWIDLKPQVQPPTDRNDAVLCYDSVNDVVVASIRAIDKQNGKEVVEGHYETWVYVAQENTWKKTNPPSEPPGWGNRRRIMVFVPDQNLVLMENYINPAQRIPGTEREQQIWTYRYADKKVEFQPPGTPQVESRADGNVITWKPSVPAAMSYKVEFGSGPTPWQAKWQAIGKTSSTMFHDRGVKSGVLCYYRVTAVDSNGVALTSPIGRAQPRLAEDLIVSVVSTTETQLLWQAAPGKDIAGYHVERAPVEVFSEDEIIRLKKDTPPLDQPSVGGIKAIGRFLRLTKTPVAQPRFVDTTVNLARPLQMDEKPLFVHRFPADRIDPQGKPYHFAVYAYRVVAVNKAGVESGPSAYALTIPPAPQWLFSKEEGTTCHLKWAHVAAKIQGYRVYRMESPRINGPGQKVTRLTAAPIPQPHYTDKEAGKVTRRYWVVAVDALGQEGYVSAPTWHLRQYRDYYVPFTGEWHQ